MDKREGGNDKNKENKLNSLSYSKKTTLKMNRHSGATK